jgi:hypothetical protein
MTVDSCDVNTGEVIAVMAAGRAVVHPLNVALATRKIANYLGPDINLWDSRFRDAFDGPTTRLVSLTPTHPLRLRDMSFVPSGSAV